MEAAALSVYKDTGDNGEYKNCWRISLLRMGRRAVWQLVYMVTRLYMGK